MIAHDEERAWLLLADAGTPVRELGNPPEASLAALPPYAELQRAEAAHAHEHLVHHVPDRCLAMLPGRYEDLSQHELPLEPEELARLWAFAPRFAELCADLAARGVPETVEHDDLHMAPFALVIAWARQRDHFTEQARAEFDEWYPVVLRRAFARTYE